MLSMSRRARLTEMLHSVNDRENGVGHSGEYLHINKWDQDAAGQRLEV